MVGEAMTTKEVAEQLGCTPRTVVNLIRRGEIAAKLFGHSYVVDRVALRRFIERRGREKPIEQ
jgi:excisionase family DNA binding protein